uniref:Uncharacterized protein n=1 Tax=Pyxicephalus adspersus TaxID=30357 RepID=A0AAV3A9Q3_PYXAD|nr:TPA: hypothetical protein GDO54_010381 [Pyxicephalus adspersus]
MTFSTKVFQSLMERSCIHCFSKLIFMQFSSLPTKFKEKKIMANKVIFVKEGNCKFVLCWYITNPAISIIISLWKCDFLFRNGSLK